MWIGLLGAVEVRPDGAGSAPVPLGGLRLRGLLARLALDAGRPVPVTVLVDDPWGDQPPGGAANALQSLVSRLRRAAAGLLLGVAATQRGATDVGNPEVLAGLAAAADDAVRRGRDLPRDEGVAALVAYVGADSGVIFR